MSQRIKRIGDRGHSICLMLKLESADCTSSEQYNSVISEHNDMFEKRPKIGSKQEQWRKERRKSNKIIRIVKVLR